MNKVEVLDFLIKNKLKHYNFFNDHEDLPNEIAIDVINKTWLVVYETDSSNKRIQIAEYTNHEEAYEDFLTRVKEKNNYNESTIKIYRLMIAHYLGVDYIAEFLDKPMIRIYTFDVSLLHLGFSKEDDIYYLDIPINQCEYVKLFSIDVYDKKNRYCGEIQSVTGDILYAINKNLETSTSKELQELAMLGEKIHKQNSHLVYKTQFIKGDENGDLSIYIPTCDLCKNKATHITNWGILLCDECYLHFCDENVEISRMSFKQRILKIVELLNGLGTILEKYIYITSVDNLHHIRHMTIEAIKTVLNTDGVLEEIPSIIYYHWCNMCLMFHDLITYNYYNHVLNNQVIIEMQNYFSKIEQLFSVFPESEHTVKLFFGEELLYETKIREGDHGTELFTTLIAKTKEHVDFKNMYSFSLTRIMGKNSYFELLSYHVAEDKIISDILDSRLGETIFFDTNISIFLFKTLQERAKYLWKKNPDSKEFKDLEIPIEVVEKWQKEDKKNQKKKASNSRLFSFLPYIILAIIAFCSILYIRVTDNKSHDIDNSEIDIVNTNSIEQEKRDFALAPYSRYFLMDGEDGNKQLFDNEQNIVLLQADEIDFQRSYLQFYRIDEYWYMYNLYTHSIITDPTSTIKIVDYFALSPVGDYGSYNEYFAISLDSTSYQIYNSAGNKISEDSFTKDEIHLNHFEEGKVVK